MLNYKIYYFKYYNTYYTILSYIYNNNTKDQNPAYNNDQESESNEDLPVKNSFKPTNSTQSHPSHHSNSQQDPLDLPYNQNNFKKPASKPKYGRGGKNLGDSRHDSKSDYGKNRNYPRGYQNFGKNKASGNSENDTIKNLKKPNYKKSQREEPRPENFEIQDANRFTLGVEKTNLRFNENRKRTKTKTENRNQTQITEISSREESYQKIEHRTYRSYQSNKTSIKNFEESHYTSNKKHRKGTQRYNKNNDNKNNMKNDNDKNLGRRNNTSKKSGRLEGPRGPDRLGHRGHKDPLSSNNNNGISSSNKDKYGGRKQRKQRNKGATWADNREKDPEAFKSNKTVKYSGRERKGKETDEQRRMRIKQLLRDSSRKTRKRIEENELEKKYKFEKIEHEKTNSKYHFQSLVFIFLTFHILK